MSALSHLSGRRSRGRGSAPTGHQHTVRPQRLAPPTPGVKPVPKVSTAVEVPEWGPQECEATQGSRALPQYRTDVEYISSEEEEDVDEEVLTHVLGRYDENKDSIKSHLADLYSSASNSCLVCISTVRHAEPVWSCPTCACSFHLVCIQKWARDGIKAPSVLSEELFPNKEVPWYCPKCRHEFSKAHIPTRYYCYCGKKADPTYDPWVAPHTCGEVCGRGLTPTCGHSCLLLCHPGKCPPCPKQVQASCYCGGRTNVTRRCGQAQWSCDTVCHKPLQCREHTCQNTCHLGDCPPCNKQSTQSCRCGKETTLRQCLQSDWQCGRVCGKRLPCQHHVCMEVCHAGPCVQCPPSLRKTCPCGKTPLPPDFPCWQEAVVCEASCDKHLPCGTHQCFKLCHLGPCETCVQVRDKPCRCGRTHKVVACTVELTCDSKCNKEKECGRHSCKRKCCTGYCLPCDKQCGKTLPCRNHKCASDCHPGRCYPCPEKIAVSCACGNARVTVACGRERNTRPPKCKRTCSSTPRCHHTTPTPHRCHPGDCPPCKQICDIKLEQCAHTCESPCHDIVMVTGLGETHSESKPCPPCPVLEHMSCYGEHEVATLKCAEVKPFSCLRPCGHILPCGNHNCVKECHYLKEGCSLCEEMCSRSRSCTHPCTRTCHDDACPPCRQYIRAPCHCAIHHISVKCIEFKGATGATLSALLSCGSACSKLLPCQHTCRSTCHDGQCSPQADCKKKVYLFCPCKRQKVEFKCGKVFGKESDYTPECLKLCAESAASGTPQPVEGDVPVTNGASEEVKKGRKRRKKKSPTEEPSFLSRHMPKIITLIGLLGAAVGIYLCTLDV